MSPCSPAFASTAQIHLLAPPALGKTLKTALEQRGVLDREQRISRVVLGSDGRVTSEESDRATTGRRKNDAATGEAKVRLCIPTTITVDSSQHHHHTHPSDDDLKPPLLHRLGLEPHFDQITLLLSTSPTIPDPSQRQNPTLQASSPSLLARVIEQWTRSWAVPATTATAAGWLNLPALASRGGGRRACGYGYTVYPPMLLLPARTLGFVAEVIAGGGGAGAGAGGGKEGARRKKELMEDLFERLCEAFQVSHIALGGPIPATMLEEQQQEQRELGRLGSSTGTNTFSSELEFTTSDNPPSPSPPRPQETPNILRSPLNSFTPLHNDFGPSLPAHHVPTRDDFAKAFWCTVRQNGIFQTWAPRYTMFSRGNLSEKTRLLQLLNTPSRTIKNNARESGLVGLMGRGGIGEEEKKRREGQKRERETISAVDLYAGVGYFAFCYAAKKEVVGKVFCWEISRWSVEGLRRGAVVNGWGVRVFEEDEQDDYDGHGAEEGKEEERLIVYRESNQHAATRIAAMRTRMPPVRHVNCGFLPSSKESWETAVQVLDPTQGGWIHAHENIAVHAFESRQTEIVQDFRNLVKRHHHHSKEDEEDDQQQWQVECVHFERVKTYAPGVFHCVLDIFISRHPRPPSDY